jgi:hypothetical protein
VHHLTRRTDTRKLSEQPLEQRATAAPEARQVEDPWSFADDVLPVVSAFVQFRCSTAASGGREAALRSEFSVVDAQSGSP